jgi:hypothetical protein
MASQNSETGSARRVENDGALVVSNRVSPGVPDEIIDELLDEGIVGQAHYSNGPSLDPNDLDPSNGTGRGSLKDLEVFSRVGGYVLAHKDGMDRIVAGRARPGSLRIERIQMSDGEIRFLKCIQLDAYADIDADEFVGIKQIANVQGRSHHTFTDFDEEKQSDEIEQIVAAVTLLERDGRLKYR